MTATGTKCQCGKPTGSTATLCMGCRKTLEVAIVNVAAYYADLDTVKARQVRFGQASITSNEQALGMDARFAKLGDGSEIEWDARNTVSTWCRYILDHVSIVPGPTCRSFCLHVSCSVIRKTRPPLDAMVSMSAYLLRWADWLRVGPLGADALDEMTDIESRLRRLIDRPADRWYAGPCNTPIQPDQATEEGQTECGESLYALSDFGEVTCRRCKAEYDVKARREWLLASADEMDAPISVIARAIVVLSDDERDEGKLAGRLRQWASRNRIMATRHRMIDGIERPLFRVGEVRDLLAEDARHAQEKLMHKRLSEKAS